MKVSTLYGVVIQFENGGQNMNSFLKEESAIEEVEKVIEAIGESGRKGLKVYLSELEYGKYNNRLLTNELINSESKLVFNN